MADISKIKLLNGSEYDIKDARVNIIQIVGDTTTGVLTDEQAASLNPKSIIEWFPTTLTAGSKLFCEPVIASNLTTYQYYEKVAQARNSITQIILDKANKTYSIYHIAYISSNFIPNLSASKITSGTFATARIPDLDASKITSGTIAPERLDIAQNLNLWNYGNVFSSGNIVTLTIDTNTYYTLSYVGTSNISIADSNWDWLVWENTTNSITFRSGTSTVYVKFNVSTNISNVMLNKGEVKYNYFPSLINMIYPVGSIYISVNSTNPSTLFGGTWEQLKDRFLLGCGDTYSNGATGGEATHTLTVDEMPRHRHDNHVQQFYAMTSTKEGSGVGFWVGNSDNWWTGDEHMSYAGGSQPHNIMPPYLAVYMWKRTA